MFPFKPIPKLCVFDNAPFGDMTEIELPALNWANPRYEFVNKTNH